MEVYDMVSWQLCAGWIKQQQKQSAVSSYIVRWNFWQKQILRTKGRRNGDLWNIIMKKEKIYAVKRF